MPILTLLKHAMLYIVICIFLCLLSLFFCLLTCIQGCRLSTCSMTLVIPVLLSLVWRCNLVCHVAAVTNAACHVVHHFMIVTQSGFLQFLALIIMVVLLPLSYLCTAWCHCCGFPVKSWEPSETLLGGWRCPCE